jgi:hypothetical protein
MSPKIARTRKTQARPKVRRRKISAEEVDYRALSAVKRPISDLCGAGERRKSLDLPENSEMSRSQNRKSAPRYQPSWISAMAHEKTGLRSRMAPQLRRR